MVSTFCNKIQNKYMQVAGDILVGWLFYPLVKWDKCCIVQIWVMQLDTIVILKNT